LADSYTPPNKHAGQRYLPRSSANYSWEPPPIAGGRSHRAARRPVRSPLMIMSRIVRFSTPAGQVSPTAAPCRRS